MDNNILAIGAVLIGLALCTSGFKIQKLIIILTWFILGYALAGYVVSYFDLSSQINTIIQIVAGIILGSLGFKLEKLALLIAVAYLAYGSLNININNLDPNMLLVVRLVISVLLGLLATFFIKPIMIIVTSLAGTAIIKGYLPTLVSIPTNALSIVLIIVLVCGVIIQFKTS